MCVRSIAAWSVAVRRKPMLAGLFDVAGSEQPIPALVPAADWLRASIVLPGGASILDADDVSSHHRTLDMRRGLLLTSGRLIGVPGLAIQLRALRLVSLSERGIGLQVVQIEVEEGAFDITFEASFGGLDFLKADRLEPELGVWRTRTSGKRLAMASASSLRLDGKVLTPRMLGAFKSTWTWRTQPGQVACFERMVAVIRSDGPADDPGRIACGKRDEARSLGWRRRARCPQQRLDRPLALPATS